LYYVPLFLFPLLFLPCSFLLDPFELPPWSPPLPWILLSAFFDLSAIQITSIYWTDKHLNSAHRNEQGILATSCSPVDGVVAGRWRT
jgi:hypothetical protein